MTFIPAFSEPQSHYPRAPPPPALGQSGGEARAAGVAPRGNPTISPHTGMIGPHPWFSNPSVHLQLRLSGDENGDPPGRNRPARCGNPNPAGRSLISWGSKMKPAPPGDHRVPSPGQKYLHKSATPTPGEENGDPRNRPVRCGNPSRTGRSLTGWRSYIKLAHPGGDRFPFQDYKSISTFTTPTTWGRKR